MNILVTGTAGYIGSHTCAEKSLADMVNDSWRW
jgi:UDP-glucose 4-epimerase